MSLSSYWRSFVGGFEGEITEEADFEKGIVSGLQKFTR